MEDTRELSLVISNPEQGQFLTRIEWNKDDFAELVRDAMARYEGVTFTEDQVSEAKKERARLNALKKAIADKRISIKNAVMAPYAQFEAEVSEITALIDKPIAEIDRQVKAFEDGRKADKKEALRQHFEQITADIEFKPTFEQVFDARYLNVSVTLAKAKKDISDKMERFRFNLRTIEGIEEEYRAIVRDVYLKTLDIGGAMGERNRLAELKRREDERKAREAAAKEEAVRKAAEAVSEKAPENAGATPNADRSAVAGNLQTGVVTPPTDGRAVRNPAQTDGEAQPQNAAYDPFANQPKKKRYKASFTVTGSMEDILAVKKFMVDNNIHFEKGVK